MPTILIVCTGNICRSPAAALLLQRAVGARVAVTSAGTHALEGGRMPDAMRALLAADGIDASDHRGRMLTDAMMREADLVVTMTRDHRDRAVQTTPSALRRSFTLAELAAAASTGARLDGTDPGQRIRAVPTAIGAHRGVMAGYEFADVPDPYGKDAQAYQRSYRLIRAAVTDVAAWLVA